MLNILFKGNSKKNMTTEEFNKLKLNDTIYQYNTNDWKIEEYKIKLINYKDKVFQINDNIYMHLKTIIVSILIKINV